MLYFMNVMTHRGEGKKEKREPETLLSATVRNLAVLGKHCAKKLKEHFKNISDVEKNSAGYLYIYGQGNVLGMKGCHIFFLEIKVFSLQRA